jgi:hypothetical protein
MGYLKLKDPGAHSAGLNNTNRIVSARPEFILVNPLEFTVSGGTAASPQLTVPQTGLISAGTELWLKFAGQAGLGKVAAGGVSESTSLVGSPGYLTITGAMLSYTGTFAWYNDASAITKLVDGDTATNVVHFENTTINTDMIIVDFGSPAHVTGGGLYKGASYSTSCTLGISYSDDRVNWTQAGNGIMKTTSGWADISWSSVGAHRYWGYPKTAHAAEQPWTELRLYGQLATVTATLSNLSPAQSSLPEKAYMLRSDTSKALMDLAKGATGQNFSTSDFTTAVAIASVTWASGPELTVTGTETAITGDTTKRLALMLRSDITAVQMRARAAKIYIKEMTA